MKKVVTIGGGTGSNVVLSGLKNISGISISAIVSTADSGGTNGMLRKALDVLPPSDARQCLVALSNNPEMKKVMEYRFPSGVLKGHSWGSIFLAVLEKTTGDFSRAIKIASEILKTKGEVIPVTLGNAILMAQLTNGKIITGEHEIDIKKPENIKKIFFKNKVTLDKDARRAILGSDYIIICPGSFHTSLLPNFLVNGFKEVVKKSKAKILLVQNIGSGKYDLTDIEKYLGKAPDVVLNGLKSQKAPKAKTDVLKRSIIRHNPKELEKAFRRIIQK
jgi:uncharacterized cofD-like protein